MSSRESANENWCGWKPGNRREQEKPGGGTGCLGALLLALTTPRRQYHNLLILMTFVLVHTGNSWDLMQEWCSPQGQEKRVCEWSVYKTLIPGVSGILLVGMLDVGPAWSSAVHTNFNSLYMPFLPSTNGPPRPISQTK